MRALTSFTTRSAMMRSRSESSRPVERLGGLADRHVADLGDRVAVDGDRRAAAARGGRRRTPGTAPPACSPRSAPGRCRSPTREWRRWRYGHDALEVGGVGAHPAVAVLVADLHLAHAGAVEERLLLLLGELRPGLVDVGAELLGHRLDEPLEVLAAGARPRRDGALGERQVGVGDDELGVDLEAGAEAVAGLAGAVGRVEREVAGRQLLEGAVAVRAGQVLGEGERVVGLAVLGAADAPRRRAGRAAPRPRRRPGAAPSRASR